MKRIIIAVLMLLPLFAAEASESLTGTAEPSPAVQTEIGWTPSLTAEAGYKGDRLQDFFGSSFYAELEADLLSMRIGRHNISLPFSFGYASVSNESGYERKQEELLFTLEARYAFRFTDAFSLGIGGGIRGQWYLGTSHLAMYAGGSIIPAFGISDWLFITVPVSVYASANDINFTIGAGISFRFGGLI